MKMGTKTIEQLNNLNVLMSKELGKKVTKFIRIEGFCGLVE
jgi:hypothetical protein